MSITIELCKLEDVDKVEELYNELNDHMEGGSNLLGWEKGVYPTRSHALIGVEEGTLYVAKIGDEVAGAVILNHSADEVYKKADWSFESDYSDVYVIHTLAVHPKFLGYGIGKEIVNFAIKQSEVKGIRAIRLDVYEENTPAIKLYEKFGFKYLCNIDLGMSDKKVENYKLYEKLI